MNTALMMGLQSVMGLTSLVLLLFPVLMDPEPLSNTDWLGLVVVLAWMSLQAFWCILYYKRQAFQLWF